VDDVASPMDAVTEVEVEDQVDAVVEAPDGSASGEDTWVQDTVGPEVTDTSTEPLAARPRSPMSTARSTSRRPILRAVVPEETQGIRVQVCEDLACAEVLVDEVSGTDTFAPGEDLPTGPVFWRVAATEDGVMVGAWSVTWLLHIGVKSAPVASSLGTRFDLGLDGIADVVVGSCGLGDCTPGVHVYQGTLAGLSTTASPSLNVPEDSLYFGFAVASAGDVDGNGFPDLIVGGLPDLTTIGALPADDTAWLFLQGPDGIAPLPANTWSVPFAYFGFAVGAAGDVNGDGYGDVLVGATIANTVYVYHGGPDGAPDVASMTLASPDAVGLGFSVAGACDVNADGYADVIGGVPTNGQALVYYGGVEGLGDAPDLLTGGGESNFGTDVACAGDVNLDGYADVLVGAPQSGTGWLYLGSADGIGLDGVPIGDALKDHGISIAGAGDVNGDGYDDLIVGGSGGARVHLSSPGETFVPTTIVLEGDVDSFGESVSGVGDVNGDGYADVVVGATELGTAYLYLGGPDGPLPTPSLVIAGPAGFGFTVAYAPAFEVRPRLRWVPHLQDARISL
jgi:hypothetical protein